MFSNFVLLEEGISLLWEVAFALEDQFREILGEKKLLRNAR